MAIKYQTINEFLLSPFGISSDVNKDSTYNTKYLSFVSSNKIRLYAVCEIEESFYYHIKIPSESHKNENYEYDVVIRFFTDDSNIANDTHLRRYNIQFFSNSPSFMYQYAYLYKKEGFLIEALYDKLDADYIDTPPEKTNANMVKSYDKSIYFACKFLTDAKFKYLEKNGVINLKKIDKRKFFQNISDFKSVRMDQALISEERKIQNILKKKSKNFGKDNNKKLANKSTSLRGKSSINVLKKKTGKAKITGKKPIRKK